MHNEDGKFVEKEIVVLSRTPLHEQACISRSARGAVWGVLTCLFVLSRRTKDSFRNL